MRRFSLNRIQWLVGILICLFISPVVAQACFLINPATNAQYTGASSLDIFNGATATIPATCASYCDVTGQIQASSAGPSVATVSPSVYNNVLTNTVNFTVTAIGEGSADIGFSYTCDGSSGTFTGQIGPVTVNVTPEPVSVSTGDNEFVGVALDPVNTKTGELFSHEVMDLWVGGPMPLYFKRYYASYLRRSHVLGDLGNNWLHNFDAKLHWNGNKIIYISQTGRVTSFLKNLVSGIWEQQDNLQTPYQLSVVTGQDVVLYDPQYRRVYTFDYTTSNVVAGKLKLVEDGKGNAHTITYDTFTGKIMRVEDGLNNILYFTYNADVIPKISQVRKGFFGPSTTYQYTDINDSENMTVYTDQFSNITTYAYENTSTTGDFALMISVTKPLANVPYTWAYYGTGTPLDSGKVASQTDASANTMTLTYNGNQTAVNNAGSNVANDTHGTSGSLSSHQDASANNISFSSDATGRRTAINDRIGGTTTYTYHTASGKVATVTHADGNTTSYSYTPRSFKGITLYDVSAITHADTTSETFVRDTYGNITSHTDQANQTSTFTYNARGQMLTAIDIAGRSTTVTYDASAIPTITDPFGHQQVFRYDNNLNSHVFVNGDQQNFFYDAKGRFTGTTRFGLKTGSSGVSYDANGNIASFTTNTLTTTFSYDGNDRLISATDPISNTTSRTFDALGRVASVTDANGNSTSFGYDLNNRLTSITDPLSNTWSRAYNAEGIPSSITDPLSNQTTFSSDAMGRITGVTLPSGSSSTMAYDAMGRITTETDPAANSTSFTRDSKGRITGVSAPSGISSSYVRDVLGNITSSTDPVGNVWSQSYDGLGRLASSTDPLGNNRTYSYQMPAFANMLTTVTYPGGLGSQEISHDAFGLIASRTYKDGAGTQSLQLTYGYDNIGNRVSGTGFANTLDVNFRVAASNGLIIGRDAGGRMTSIALDGIHSITYAYDANDQLVSVTDWNAGVTTFTYDAAGRRTSMVRPNGITTTYSYDVDGRVTAMIDGALGSLSLTRDAKGQITAATRSVPLAASADTLAGLTRSYDAAAQVSTAGFTFDALGRRTADPDRAYVWDAASRLSSYTEAATTVDQTYDALGRRLTRKVAGIGKTYTWNDALGIPSVSVVIDNSSGPNSFRHYIHTPSGELLYSMEATSGALNLGSRQFYHYDEMGNTTFVTDDAGTVLASYAYTPYGKLISSTGALDNPFTWQGRLGVMDEGNGLYYARARFYDSKVGQFITRDAIKGKSPRSLNPYQYAYNNPVQYVDWSGNKPEMGEVYLMPKSWFRKNGINLLQEANASAIKPGEYLAAIFFGPSGSRLIAESQNDGPVPSNESNLESIIKFDVSSIYVNLASVYGGSDQAEAVGAISPAMLKNNLLSAKEKNTTKQGLKGVRIEEFFDRVFPTKWTASPEQLNANMIEAGLMPIHSREDGSLAVPIVQKATLQDSTGEVDSVSDDLQGFVGL